MRALLATLASGLLYGVLFPPLGLAGLAWLALVPLVLALRGRSLWGAAALGGLFAWVGTASVVPWLAPTLHDHFEKSWAFGAGFWLLFSATALAPYYSPLLAAQAWAARRLPRAFAPLLFACAWTGAEWLRVQLGFRSPWTRLGDALVDAAWLRQAADLFGVYGLSFLLAMGNGVVAEVAAAGFERARGRLPSARPLLLASAAWVALVCVALAYGAQRLDTLELGDSDFEVALVQGNLDPELRWRRMRAGKVLHRYGGLTRDLLRQPAARRPDLVVWPENAVQTPVDDPVYGPPLLRLASNTPLLVGAPRSEARDGGRHAFNSVFLLDESGVKGHYDKRRLLPFSETRPLGRLASFGRRGDLDASEYTPGSSPALFEVAGRKLAPLVCMEALYPELAREAVRSGAGVLVNLSNDGWFAGHGGLEQHLAMVRFRAVETRRPLLRSTTTGISAVIAPDGSVVATLGAGEQGVLRARVPRPARGLTLYTRSGDLFAMGCVLATAAAVLTARHRRGPQTRAGSGPSIPRRSSA